MKAHFAFNRIKLEIIMRIARTVRLIAPAIIVMAAVFNSTVVASPISLTPRSLFKLEDPSLNVQANISYSGPARIRGGNVIELGFGTASVTPVNPWSYLSFEVVIPDDQATPFDANNNPIPHFANLFLYSDTGFTNLLQTITLELELEPRLARTPTLFQVSLPSPQIAAFQINRNGSTSITVDQWRFSENPVVTTPEPGSLPLLLGALAGVVSVTRRRRINRIR
ncbi:MAG: PEP-CTERM sorting domain-containing protein [Proteobacteria bacterium]|nr:PEP-CTERM sorting domain-containing protein [Pseudomonadota bacterium]